MKRSIRAAIAAGTLVFSPQTQAHAFMAWAAVDVVCQGASVTDVTREAGWQTGVVTGVVAKTTPGTLTCRIYVNGFEKWSASSHTVYVVAVHVAAIDTAANYPATAQDDVRLCAIFTPDSGPAEWWDPGSDPVIDPGAWRPLPVQPYRCRGLQVEPNYPECGVLKSVDSRLGTPLAEVWQDCEPYPPII